MADSTDKTDSLYQAITELEKYVELEGTEWAETAAAAIRLWHCRTYISQELLVVLEKELLDSLEYVKENAVITEREETFTRKIIDMEWL